MDSDPVFDFGESDRLLNKTQTCQEILRRLNQIEQSHVTLAKRVAQIKGLLDSMFDDGYCADVAKHHRQDALAKRIRKLKKEVDSLYADIAEEE